MSAPPRVSSLLDRPIASSSLVDQVVERLETAIMNGELKGGARLSEQALATSLGVSRSPLREALRRLEGRRLIERVPNIGARVTLLLGHDLEEILAIREVLEALACRLAAANLTDDDLKDLERQLESRRNRNSVKAPVLYDRSGDHDFHAKIIMASGNRKLIDMLLGDLYYLMRVHRYRSSTTPDRAKNAPLEHQAVLAALKARDPDAAQKAMHDHLLQAHANIRREIVDSRAKEPAIVEAKIFPKVKTSRVAAKVEPKATGRQLLSPLTAGKKISRLKSGASSAE